MRLDDQLNNATRLTLFVFKGLECINSWYIKAFANNQIDGRQLLGIRSYELEELGILSVGHQEVILEAVEHLKNFVSRNLSLFTEPEITK